MNLLLIIVSALVPLCLAAGWAFFDSPFRTSEGTLRTRSVIAAAVIFAASCLWASFIFEVAGDFTGFYIAAHLKAVELNNTGAYERVAASQLPPMWVHSYTRFVRPPIFQVLLRPLAFFPFFTAFYLWAGVNLAAYLTSTFLLVRRLRLPGGLFPAFAAFLPVVYGITIGQDIAVLALLIVVAVFLLESKREVAAGILLGLCLYKFNLVIFVGLALLLKKQWRALLAMGCVGVLILIASSLVLSPAAYVQSLRSASNVAGHMVFGGVRGSFLLLHLGWLYIPALVIGTMFCVYLIKRLPMAHAMAAALTANLLLGYYVSLYDCALLILPIAVLWNKSRTQEIGMFLLLALQCGLLWFVGLAFFQTSVELMLLALFAKEAGVFRFLARRQLPALKSNTV